MQLGNLKKIKMSKNYNTTQLDPDKAFERHIYHRDQFAHYLRWSHVLKRARKLKNPYTVLDFGCGTSANLLEALYRNRLSPQFYIGYDIRNLDKAREKFKDVNFDVYLQEKDLVKDEFDTGNTFDMVTSFEVIEHIGKQNASKFMENIHKHCHDDTQVLISTPIYDEKVGAAGNHTFDSGDGRGVAPQEFGYDELQKIFEENFEVVEVYGTFSSQKDYKKFVNENLILSIVFDALKKYYCSEITSVMMAPLIPARMARNALWVLKKK